MVKSMVVSLVFVVFIVLMLLPINAVAKLEIKEDVDKFEGGTTIWMDANEKIDIKDYPDCVDLSAEKDIDPNAVTKYFLVVYYDSSCAWGNDEDLGWLFIQEGVSLLLKVDGELFEFATAWKPSTDVGYGGSVHEFAYYEVEPEFLWKIASAKEIEVRVKGEHYLDGKFKDKIFGQFKQFCEYVGITGDTTVIK